MSRPAEVEDLRYWLRRFEAIRIEARLSAQAQRITQLEADMVRQEALIDSLLREVRDEGFRN